VEVVTAPEVEEPAAQLSASELPDWLSLGDSEEEVVTLTSDNIPDWLQNAKPDDVVPISEDDLAWLSSSQAEPVELPDWLQPMTPVAEVTRAPEPPSPPPVKKPEVKPPEPARPAPQRQTAPAGQRIHVARKLAVEEQVPKALEVYQQLIDDQAGLEEVRADLRELVKTKPKEPRAKRLLGDTHMRLGDLQSALDAYRSALSDL
jgi:tetratricopeptide (TPR) repeat protein